MAWTIHTSNPSREKRFISSPEIYGLTLGSIQEFFIFLYITKKVGCPDCGLVVVTLCCRIQTTLCHYQNGRPENI